MRGPVPGDRTRKEVHNEPLHPHSPLDGPLVLLLLGVVALLHQADLVSWSIFIPLLLILIGVLKLAAASSAGRRWR